MQRQRFHILYYICKPGVLAEPCPSPWVAPRAAPPHGRLSPLASPLSPQRPFPPAPQLSPDRPAPAGEPAAPAAAEARAEATVPEPEDAPGSPLFRPLCYSERVAPDGEGLLHYQKYWYKNKRGTQVGLNHNNRHGRKYNHTGQGKPDKPVSAVFCRIQVTGQKQNRTDFGKF